MLGCQCRQLGDQRLARVVTTAMSECDDQAVHIAERNMSCAMIGELKVSQSGDTMIVVHPDMAMQKLTRTSANTFSRAAYAFDVSSGKTLQPYFRFSVPSITITPASTGTGSQTFTASSSVFSSRFYQQPQSPLGQAPHPPLSFLILV